jgi:GNAT superfamily N-acetyltransferase
MPAQTVVFHLQGEHDQQSHAGGRGASGGRVAGYIDVHDTDMVRDAFDADFTTVNGRKVHSLIDEIRTDDPKMTDVRGTLYAEDPIGDEMYRVGQFRRMLYADGEVYNDSLYVWPSQSNEGIGTAFLDYSERQLANAGFDTILVDAVEIGQYAWAARGYKLQDFEVRMGTHRDWLELAAVQNDELGGKFTTEIDALARSWDAPGADVYGADLIALDPAFSSVFLEGPSWSGTRSIASLRDPLVASTAGLEVFHLDGQHDQQSHAGGRGASYGGDRTGYPEVDAVIEDFLDEPQGDWTTSDTKIGDMEAVDCAGACDSVAEQFTEYATERGLKVYTTRTSVDEMGYEITGDPAGEVMDADGNIVDGFYQDHTVNQVYVDGQGWPLTIDFTARQYGYDTPVKTDPAVREDDGLAVEVFHLQGQHDQKAHGRRGAGSPIEDLVGGSDGRSPKHQGYFGEITFGRYHGTEDTGVYSVTVQEHGDSSSWENDQYDVEITTDEDGNMTAAEVTRRVTRNDIGNPEMAADDLNSLFEEHGVILGWGDAVVDGRRVQTVDEAAEIAREEALEEARGVAYETLWSAYNFDVTDRNGESFLVESDPTVDNPGFGVVQGRIRSYAWTDRGSYDGETIGTFEREVDLAFGRVDNSSFKIEPAWQGRGIGTAFLDRSEAALADAGIERSRLTAVDVGRYAWMARGYQVSLTDRASVVSKWVPEIESILETREFTDVQRSQARAVTRSWQAGDDVYGADLLSVSDEFADVFLNGPTYTASRELVPSPRARAWVDPNQTELDLSVEVFHLQGQHNQKDHGRRGGARSGIDALEASDIPVMTDEYGELLITSTGVDRIRQIAYDYDGGSDVYDVVIVENDDGTIAVDVENLYGMDGTIEGEQALERYLNDNGIDDVRWDGERGTLHASHRAAVMAGDATAAQKLLVDVEEAYSGSFEVSGETYVIGETSTHMREAPPILGEDNASVEIRGSIMQGDVTGKEVGTFSRTVYEDGTVYNHSLSIDRDLQGQGIGTAFLEMTEGALQPEVIKMAAVNVGKYAWAARGYKLDVESGNSLAASARDRWIFAAKEALSNTPEWRAGDFTTIDKLGALERAWMDDLNSVYPADLLAIDPSLKSVLLEGPSWDAVKRRDDDRALTAAAGLEVFHLQGQHDQQTHAGGRRASRPDGVGYLESWRFGTDEYGRPGIERRVYAYTGWDDEYGELDTNSPVEERWAVDGRGEGDGVLDYAPPPSADVASNLTDDEVAAIRAELAAADPSVLDGIEMSASGLPRAGLSVPDRLILNELNAHLTAPVPSDLADKYRGLLAGGDVRAVADAAFDDFAITPESGLIYTVGSEWNASALSKLGVSVGLTVNPDAYGYMRSASGAIGNQRRGDPPVDYARAKEISAALPTSLSLATTAVNRHTQDVISEMYPSGQVPVYRGVTRPAVEGAVSINPVSSWSLEAQWAANFGERSVKATVPVSSVFSYGAATGWGAQSEAEVILSTPSQTVTIDEVRTEDRWETFASEGALNIDEGEEDWIKQAAVPRETVDLSIETFHLQGQHDQSNHGNRGGGRDLGPAQARALVEAAPPIVRNKATAEHEAAVKALQSVGRGIYDSAYSSLTPEQVSILNGAPTLDPDIFPKEHDAIRRVEQVLAERTMASLRQARPFGRDSDFKAFGDPEFTGVVEDAAAMYPTDWFASSYGVDVKASGTTGGWYLNGEIGLPRYGPTDPAGIPRDTSKKLYRAAVHELGHHLEVENPNVLKAAQMFLATRKSGAFKPGSSVGVQSKLKVVDGEFRNPYSGVIYGATDIGGSDGTEVLTTHMYSMQFALDGPAEPNWSIQDQSLFAPPRVPNLRDAWLEETYYALGVLASL